MIECAVLCWCVVLAVLGCLTTCGLLRLLVDVLCWCVLPSNVRSRSRCAPASCAKARLTRRVLSSRRLSHIRQRAEFSLPCLGVYHWLSTQAPLTPARQDRSSYATFASARLRHGALASFGNIDCLSRMLHPPSATIGAAMLRRRDTVSSPCDVSHRASDEPRRCMSLSSALAPSSLASPSIRRVFLRSVCARRCFISSLNLARVSPGAKRSRRRRAQCGVQIRRDFVRTVISFHHFLALLRTNFW